MKEISIKENEFLTAYNFARKSDVVFSEIVSKQEYSKLKNESSIIIYTKENEICYVNSYLEIKENSVIFSNTDFTGFLFKYLKNSTRMKNLKLITHWSDTKIDEDNFIKKPDSISNWYGININLNNSNLTPIPLGLSGNYSPKNLIPKYFLNNKSKGTEIKKSTLLYINFQKNTNHSERDSLSDIFKGVDWVKIDSPNLDLKEYLLALESAHFVLCPFGNGFDTHRLWETLYAGSIPIVLSHKTYKSTDNLPVLVVKSFKDINEELLLDTLKKFESKNFEFDKLKVNYWIDKIKSDTLNSENIYYIRIPKLNIYFLKISFTVNRFINRSSKKILFRFRQIRRKIKDI
jgi:hypothetical protein